MRTPKQNSKQNENYVRNKFDYYLQTYLNYTSIKYYDEFLKNYNKNQFYSEKAKPLVFVITRLPWSNHEQSAKYRRRRTESATNGQPIKKVATTYIPNVFFKFLFLGVRKKLQLVGISKKKKKKKVKVVFLNFFSELVMKIQKSLL